MAVLAQAWVDYKAGGAGRFPAYMRIQMD